MSCPKSKRLATVLTVTAITLASVSANAAVVTFVLDTQYTGDQPDGYVTLVFSDEAAGLNAGEVKMTLTGFLEGNEDLKTLGFNFNPDQGAADAGIIAALQFLNEVKTFSGSVTISKEMNALQGDLGPYGDFDILIEFPDGSPAGRFSGADTLSYTLKSNTLALVATMFDSLTPNGFAAAAAAHVRNTDGQAGSGKVTTGDDDDDDDDDEIPQVPTPAALPAGLALIGLATIRRRRHAA